MSLDTAFNSVGSPPPPPPASERPAGSPVSRVKERRRPLLFALMAGLVAAGALVGAWAWTTASDTEQVLAMASTVHRGETIENDDLVVIEVGGNAAVGTVSSTERASIVGQVAARDLPAGFLVTSEAAFGKTVPEEDTSIVGVSLTAAMMPSEPLYAGDRVRIVATPDDQGEVETDTAPATIDATVVGVRAIPETGETVVDVAVPHDRAAELAARAASGKVALVLDSREH